MKKMWSLLKKDLWTSFTDKTIVLMLFTPVLLGIIFKIVTYDEWMILLTMSLFNLVLAPLCNFPLLITEEKERGTLPLLFRSKVTEATHRGTHGCYRIFYLRSQAFPSATVSPDQPDCYGVFSTLWIPDRGIRQGSEQCKCIQYA